MKETIIEVFERTCPPRLTFLAESIICLSSAGKVVKSGYSNKFTAIFNIDARLLYFLDSRAIGYTFSDNYSMDRVEIKYEVLSKKCIIRGD